MNQKLIIVGGANGVGKTTFAYQYKQEYNIPYLGADEIAKKLTLETPGNVELKAGKLFFKQLDACFSDNQSVIVESTLSGLSLSERIKTFKAKNYSVHIIYVFLENVELCKQRIRLRVKKGGHNVPVAEITRRYQRSLVNFQKVYRPLANTWQIFYNGFERPLEVAIGEQGKLMILDEEYYQKFQELSK